MPFSIKCEQCGRIFQVKPFRFRRGVRFCSNACRHVTYAQFKRTIREDGYVQITGNGVNTLEHRYIMEQYLGRSLETREHVHHKNELRNDNRVENLKILIINEHSSLHHPGRDKNTWVTVECKQCKKIFEKRKNQLQKHPECFCSHLCFVENKRKWYKCKHCKTKFTTNNPKRIFCSQKCYRNCRKINK